MGLTKFLGNEFVDIIEWLQSDGDTMVYRFPRYRNEIKYGAKLTVREGQTAIFINEGKIADVFPPGIYELKTANLPILSTLQHWGHGFESPFKAEVYFFNTTDFLNQKWGARQPVLLNDPQFGIVRLRAFGSYTLRVINAEVLLKKLVGTDGNFEINEVSEQITRSIVTRFPEILAESHISVMELPTRYSELASSLKETLTGECESYGLAIGKIYIESIALPENVQKVLDEKTSLNIIGDDISQYTQMQAAKGLAEGGEGSTMASAGAGMAIGMEMARQMTDDRRESHKSHQEREGESKKQNSATTQAHTGELLDPPPLGKIYYLMLMGERVGPMTINDVYDNLNSGDADAYTLIWRKGMAEWQTIENTSDIDLRQLPPPLPSDKS